MLHDGPFKALGSLQPDTRVSIALATTVLAALAAAAVALAAAVASALARDRDVRQRRPSRLRGVEGGMGLSGLQRRCLVRRLVVVPYALVDVWCHALHRGD